MTQLDQKLPLERVQTVQEAKALSDQELVDACNSGTSENREAWNEFFTRFGPLVREAIVHVIRKRTGSYAFGSEDDDTVSGIGLRIVKKLYVKGGLAECRDTRGVRPWLRTVATNQAKDWFRGIGTEENLPDTEATRETVALDETISDDGEIPRGDLTEDRGTVTSGKIGNAEEIMMAAEENEILGDLLPVLTRMQELRNYWITRLGRLAVESLSKEEVQDLAGFSRTAVTAVNADLERISAKIALDRRKYWILRLSILATERLTLQEAEELASFCRLPSDEVRKRIEEIDALLERKREEREAQLGKAELYRYQLIRMERRRYEAARRGAQADVERLEAEIAEKSSKREELIRKGGGLPRPPNKEIALLVGLPKEQEGQVTTILSRVQDRIRQGWEQALRDRERGKSDFDLADYLYL